MNFALGIVIYLIVFVILLWGFSRFGMGIFSSLTVTALLSGIVLLACIPPSEIEHQIDLYYKEKPHKCANNWIVILYLLIMILTLILITVYILWKAFEDREKRCKVLGSDYNSDFRDYLALW